MTAPVRASAMSKKGGEGRTVAMKEILVSRNQERPFRQQQPRRSIRIKNEGSLKKEN
jgi:hypothetical protein